ncbi:hypothetical protein LCGC14_2797550 [marine sediment metagenome]|uniref:Uncharacterized protein n=1 Tax=marine sediment metagenome TaxID=412755 RepID=A0A0F9AXD0_9ZZZZ
MAEVEESIRALLLTLSTVTDKVGTGTAARIRPDRLYQADDKTLAAVIVEVDDEEKLNTLDGLGGRVMASVNLKCRARSSKAASRALAEAVRVNGTDPGTGLAGYTGTVGGMAIDAWLEDMQTSFVKDDDGSDNGFYDTDCAYMITFTEVI